jgi:hypothetical protein
MTPLLIVVAATQPVEAIQKLQSLLLAVALKAVKPEVFPRVFLVTRDVPAVEPTTIIGASASPKTPALCLAML